MKYRVTATVRYDGDFEFSVHSQVVELGQLLGYLASLSYGGSTLIHASIQQVTE